MKQASAIQTKDVCTSRTNAVHMAAIFHCRVKEERESTVIIIRLSLMNDFRYRVFISGHKEQRKKKRKAMMIELCSSAFLVIRSWGRFDGNAVFYFLVFYLFLKCTMKNADGVDGDENDASLSLNPPIVSIC